MELIKEFFWDIKAGEITERKWNARRAVRALVRDGDKIGILKSTKYNFYKCLPGGGVDGNEDLITALRREIQEEVGCKINIVDELGMCLEFIGDLNLIQISYVYVVDKIKDTKQMLTEEEINAGFVLEWHTPEKVLDMIKKAKTTDKRGEQQMLREKTLLEYYLKK